jgi:hypothetical protein
MTAEQHPSEPEENAGLLLTRRLAYWNDILNGLENGDARDSLAKNAVDELDKLWEQEDMYHAECFVSGFGFWLEPREISDSSMPEYDDDEPEMVLQTNDFVLKIDDVVSKEAISRGFAYTNKFPGERPQLWHQFEIEPFMGHIHPGLYTQHQRWMFIDPITANIVAAAKFDEPFELDHSDQCLTDDERIDRLDKHSLKLAKLVGSTAFRRTHRKRQLELIDQSIETAEQEVASRFADVIISPHFAYLPEISSEYPGEVVYRELTLKDTTLSGVCLGLTMTGVEQLRKNHKAIRRDSDLLNKYDGLSMSIALSDDLDFSKTGGMLEPGSVLHIPLSSQRLEIVMQTREYIHEILEGEEE